MFVTNTKQMTELSNWANGLIAVEQDHQGNELPLPHLSLSKPTVILLTSCIGGSDRGPV